MAKTSSKPAAPVATGTAAPKKRKKPSYHKIQMDAGMAADLEMARDLSRVIARRFRNAASTLQLNSRLKKISAPHSFYSYAKSWAVLNPVAGAVILPIAKAMAASGDAGHDLKLVRQGLNALADGFEGRKTVTMLKQDYDKCVAPAVKTYLETRDLDAAMTDKVVALKTVLLKMEAVAANTGFKKLVKSVSAELDTILAEIAPVPDPGDEFVRSILSKRLTIAKSDDAKDLEEHLVYGIVLEPETVDSQGDIYSAEEIRKAAHDFMERSKGTQGLQHKYNVSKSVMVLETYVAPAAFKIGKTAIKKGTWLMASRVLDEAIWESIKKDEITGYSIGGDAKETPVM